MKPTVLVADDDPQLLAVLEDVLAKEFTVVTARSGTAALTQFERHKIDIVVTDLAMPGLNGLQVAANCKAMRPNVPVVMLTAWDVLVSDDDATEAGVDEMIAKPVRVLQLGDLLRKRLATSVASA